MSEPNAQPLPTDYDRDPERFRAGVRTVERYAAEGNIHGPLAERLHAERPEPVLDCGCGEGRLMKPASLYLYGHGLAKTDVDEAASKVSNRLDVTKRGALIFGYKRD